MPCSIPVVRGEHLDRLGDPAAIPRSYREYICPRPNKTLDTRDKRRHDGEINGIDPSRQSLMELIRRLDLRRVPPIPETR